MTTIAVLDPSTMPYMLFLQQYMDATHWPGCFNQSGVGNNNLYWAYDENVLGVISGSRGQLTCIAERGGLKFEKNYSPSTSKNQHCGFGVLLPSSWFTAGRSYRLRILYSSSTNDNGSGNIAGIQWGVLRTGFVETGFATYWYDYPAANAVTEYITPAYTLTASDLQMGSSMIGSNVYCMMRGNLNVLNTLTNPESFYLLRLAIEDVTDNSAMQSLTEGSATFNTLTTVPPIIRGKGSSAKKRAYLGCNI